ncbi:MAG TPA: FIST N-terminal domain-containing protein [Pirellulales bacterium]|nr:FIST N-terminal domain-containing protein [Pirellulales bacterium]
MTQTGQKAHARFGAALSLQPDSGAAVDEACRAALSQLGTKPDLAVVFVSPHHRGQLAQVAVQVCDAIGSEALLGCTGESIIGGNREIESQPAVSVWLASLPNTTIKLMHLNFEQTREGSIFTGWPADLPEPWPAESAMLLLGEPFSFPADEVVRRFNEDHPGAPVLGGMASGGVAPGENRLVLGRGEQIQGAVAALLYGSVRIRSVVSQGCRPVGKPYVITRAESNVIQELGGAPPLSRLQEVFQTLTEQERWQARRGLHVGRVLSEYQDEFHRGDFLVRNVIGVDPNTGAIAVGDYMRTGQTVQFHIRDEVTADEDLRHLLRTAVMTGGEPAPAGALLFSCNGRGTRMFSSSNHDINCLRDILGDIPVAGFFAQGEIGPVGNQNFLHGFTASVALFDG